MRKVFADDCPFCAIAKGEDHTVQPIAEAEDWLAFFPLEPATVGHTLVIPRTHVRDLWDAPVELTSTLAAAAVTVGRSIDEALQPDGMNLITSAGKTAEQTVFHLHLHLVPRWADDKFGRIWPLEGTVDETAVETAADKIRTAWSSVDPK